MNVRLSDFPFRLAFSSILAVMLAGLFPLELACRLRKRVE
jgi:hypothetical protein